MTTFNPTNGLRTIGGFTNESGQPYSIFQADTDKSQRFVFIAKTGEAAIPTESNLLYETYPTREPSVPTGEQLSQLIRSKGISPQVSSVKTNVEPAVLYSAPLVGEYWKAGIQAKQEGKPAQAYSSFLKEAAGKQAGVEANRVNLERAGNKFTGGFSVSEKPAFGKMQEPQLVNKVETIKATPTVKTFEYGPLSYSTILFGKPQVKQQTQSDELIRRSNAAILAGRLASEGEQLRTNPSFLETQKRAESASEGVSSLNKEYSQWKTGFEGKVKTYEQNIVDLEKMRADITADNVITQEEANAYNARLSSINETYAGLEKEANLKNALYASSYSLFESDIRKYNESINPFVSVQKEIGVLPKQTKASVGSAFFESSLFPLYGLKQEKEFSDLTPLESGIESAKLAVVSNIFTPVTGLGLDRKPTTFAPTDIQEPFGAFVYSGYKQLALRAGTGPVVAEVVGQGVTFAAYSGAFLSVGALSKPEASFKVKGLVRSDVGVSPEQGKFFSKPGFERYELVTETGGKEVSSVAYTQTRGTAGLVEPAPVQLSQFRFVDVISEKGIGKTIAKFPTEKVTGFQVVAETRMKGFGKSPILSENLIVPKESVEAFGFKESAFQSVGTKTSGRLTVFEIAESNFPAEKLKKNNKISTSIFFQFLKFFFRG